MLKLFSVMNTTHRGSNGPLQEKEMSIYHLYLRAVLLQTLAFISLLVLFFYTFLVQKFGVIMII